ncbi:hypothetical protein [Oceanobacter kriegii]|uniref:hypothetical protein n=1 Tax=Oceanobacter kriegii TaxID=64972 RepID=UPI0004092729|nr:hypothetical protein [Oceanobacter kriegii]
MLLSSLLGFVAVVMLLILIVVGVMWIGKPWVIQWIKGTAGILLLFGGFLLVYSGVDLYSYKQANGIQPAVTISTYKVGDQTFDLSLVDEEGNEQRYIVKGDQWQLDFRLLRWTGPIDSLAAAPVYRIDRLSGRYLSLEQERTAERTVYGLGQGGWIDVWSVLKEKGFWLKPEMGSAVFMPLVNGATFAVTVSAKGVEAEAMNDVAAKALDSNW